MLLACDVGNSSVKIAIYDKEKRISFGLYPKNDFSCATDILSLTTKSNLRFDQIKSVIISSVVPQITEELKKYVEKSFKTKPTIINNKTKLSITIDKEFNENIGPDILVMSSYAYSMFKEEVLIISLGTATVFSYVNKKGVLKGCAIAPGFKSFSSSLSEKSILLPSFTPKYQEKYLATNTIDAMSIGAYNGFIGMVKTIKSNIIKEIGFTPRVVLCGGHSEKVTSYIKGVDYQESDFVISGLNIIHLKK